MSSDLFSLGEIRMTLCADGVFYQRHPVVVKGDVLLVKNLNAVTMCVSGIHVTRVQHSDLSVLV